MKLALVMGVDGSGKSTFMDTAVESKLTILEPTGSPEAKAF